MNAALFALLLLPQVDEYKVSSPTPLGSLLLVRLEKQRYWIEDNWFCRYITVETPGGDKVTFPCYRWLIGDIKLEIRTGAGMKRLTCSHVVVVKGTCCKSPPSVSSAKTLRDESSPQLLEHRKTELQERQRTYRFNDYTVHDENTTTTWMLTFLWSFVVFLHQVGDVGSWDPQVHRC